MATYLEALLRVVPLLKTQDPTKYPPKNNAAADAVDAGHPPPGACTPNSRPLTPWWSAIDTLHQNRGMALSDDVQGRFSNKDILQAGCSTTSTGTRGGGGERGMFMVMVVT
jgi:hypothetical protein